MIRLLLVTFIVSAEIRAACTATVQNHAESPVIGFPDGGTPPAGNNVSLTATVNAPGDLVVVAAWCFPPDFSGAGCTSSGVTIGSQTAIQTTVATNLDQGTSGTPGSGKGWIYYVLASAASGSVSITFSTVETQQLQIAYIDFKPSTGCVFSHDIDSPLGASSAGSGMTVPSYSPTAGDVLYNFTMTNTHMVDPVGSPWSALTWNEAGQNSHFLANSVNLVAYDLSAPGGSVANNSNTLHPGSDSLQALLTSFKMTQLSANQCPAGLPVTGNSCYFVASNGSDSNSGAYENAPWLNAPGMPNCASNCLTKKNTGMSAGQGIILRGGDTWHFGNSGASPYTGGTWDMTGGDSTRWDGNETNCVFEGTQTGCIYYGVDLTWFSGGSWSRPILTGDNSTSTSLISSCTYQITSPTHGAHNDLTMLGSAAIFDNFELTGLCSNEAGDPGSNDSYMAYFGNGNGCATGNTSPACMAFITNVYVHGWTATTTAGHSSNSQPCVIIGGGFNGLQTIDHVVVDGQDSSPGSCTWGTFPSFYHFRDSIIRYTNQGVGAWCHDIHDNIFEYLYEHNSGAGSHTNVLECNSDNTGNALHQPQNTPNVFYNNIVRHLDPTLSPDGQVNLWFCPNTISEYWFNNTVYDTGYGNNGNFWAIAGSPTYASCTNTGGQFMFNNTISGGQQPCHLGGSNTTGGQYLTVLNEHLLNVVWDSTGCTGRNDASNIAMTWATGTSQGYMSGSAGRADANTCANDTTTPCKPTASNNGTVSAGGNHQAYCTALAAFSSEPAIGTDAANACQFGTTDACTYNTSTHAMTCPAQTAVARPASAAWDSGAYQFSAAAPNSPSTAHSNMAIGNTTVH